MGAARQGSVHDMLLFVRLSLNASGSILPRPMPPGLLPVPWTPPPPACPVDTAPYCLRPLPLVILSNAKDPSFAFVPFA